MYVPKHQYKEKSASEFGPLQDAEGKPNTRAKVILISTGQIFAVAAADLVKGIFTNAIELFEVKNSGEDYFEEASDFLSSLLKVKPSIPTQEDIDESKPTIKRYFHKNNSTGKITEISEDNFYELTEENLQRYESTISIEWKVEGPADDIVFENGVYQGAISVNKQTIKQADLRMPGLEDFIGGMYAMLVRDVETTGVKKQVLQDPGILIPSPSQELAQ